VTYPIERSFRQTMLLGAVLFGGAAALCCAVMIGERSLDIALTLAAIGCAAAAWWCVRFYRTADRYTVELSDDGIAVGSGQPVPWSSITGVRERGVGQRLELLDAGGTRLASIGYQVEYAWEVVREVRQRSRIAERVPSSAVFGKRRSAANIASTVVSAAIMCGFAVWLWIEVQHWLVVAMSVFLLWAIYTDLRDDVSQVELRERDLVIRTFLREQIVARESIAEADLTLRLARMQKQLATEVVQHDGTVIELRPPGVDVVELTTAIRRWLGTTS
jgi:hypothetical protein